MLSDVFFSRICQFCNLSQSSTEEGRSKKDSEKMLDNLKYLLFICMMKGYKMSFVSASTDIHDMKMQPNILLGKCSMDGNADDGFLGMKFWGLEEKTPENEEIVGYSIIEKPILKGYN